MLVIPLRLLFRICSFFQLSVSVSRHLPLTLLLPVSVRRNRLYYGGHSVRSGVKYNRNNEYSLCNGNELGSLSLTVLVISVIAFCPLPTEICPLFLLLIDYGIVAVSLCCLSSLIDLGLSSFLYTV